MRAFSAIVKLTLHNAVRSHIFQLLLIVLAVCAIGIPLTVAGDGTAGGFIQVALLYSFSSVSAILALSSLWVSCFIMTQDIESYQLHMVVSKPVSRIKIWLAKYTGVLLMHVFLLILSALAIYFIIIWQFTRQDFSKADREKIESEVLVGRRVFNFAPPNIEERSKAMLRERLQKMAETGERISITTQNEESIMKEMRRMAVAENAQAKYDEIHEWRFENFPVNAKERQALFLRYRTYVGKVSSKDQRMTTGVWYIGVPQFELDSQGKIVDEKKYQIRYYQYPPSTIRSGEFDELILPKQLPVVTPDGKVFLAYRNLDPEKQTQYFQPSDGPKILMKVTGFFANFVRAVAVILLELIILTGLGCAFASFLSLPTAIFMSIAYLFFGSFAIYLAESAADEAWLRILSDVLLFFVIPLQKFGVTDMVSNGELIELSFMGKLFLSYFVLRTLPLVLIGMYIYKRREIGLVVRK
ncbi:MAG: hypothetical protein IKB71_06145 [Lentisphaeria bacterium]|nr:hypothetical protein [Lentisphaeria bacterium]